MDWIFDEPEQEERTCQCCGRPVIRLVGGIFKDGEVVPYVLYSAELTPCAPTQHRVRLALCIGDWSDGSAREGRRVVAMEIWVQGDQFVTGLVDAEHSSLGGMNMGIELSASAVRESDWKAEAFEISDAVLREHALLRRHLLEPGDAALRH